MKKITIKSALMRLVAVVLLTLGTISVSAQYYMNVVQKDGVKAQYLVSDIDSVYFSDRQSPTADYEYVDLGLSVLWATCNVGATKPEEYGDYYAWGETETKDTYSWSTYKWCNGSRNTQTKYNTSSSYGTVDNKTVLDPEDDVAHVKWGGSWRLPTKEEQDELCSSCTWTWYSSGNTEFNGVAGYKVTSNVSGYTDRFIFLPAAGYRGDTILSTVGSGGYYWSSSLSTDRPYGAWGVYVNLGAHGTYYDFRAYGLSVRPVCPSEEWLNVVSITLNGNLGSIVMGNTITLSTTVKRGYEVIDSEVTWISDNPSIASVSETGVVTAIAVGSTTITAICMGKTATCTITVIEPQNENGYEYVDLGLSVKWATCNVGATKPEEYGDYYAWGETETKTIYTWTNYKFRTSGDSRDNVKFSKYNTSSSYGTVDKKTVLDSEDDVAHVKWGGSWRLPTKEEQDDLRNKCTWTWYSSGNTEFNGVAGYKVTSNVSGYIDHFIFLPAAGLHDDTDLYYVGSLGDYWSSSPDTDNPDCAWYVYFNSGFPDPNYLYRAYGLSVRPVCPSEEWLNVVSITLNGNLGSIVMGNTITLSTTIKRGYEVIDSEVTWISDNPSIASVSETGVVTAIAVGSTTITAICMGKTATCTITVIEPQNENGYEYVDLGLSVKWATCNVGATKPEEYGDYYAWGETETKTIYTWTNYKFRTSGDSWDNVKFSKYNTSSSYGTVDKKTVLDPEDDVAHVKWGGSWRMPTKAEQDELCDSCTWTWYNSGNREFNGVAGYKVTSNVSGYKGRFIFLPAAGYRNETVYLFSVGFYGFYWSSSLYKGGGPNDAWSVLFNGGDHVTYYYGRGYGYSVRPVCP